MSDHKLSDALYTRFLDDSTFGDRAQALEERVEELEAQAKVWMQLLDSDRMRAERGDALAEGIHRFRECLLQVAQTLDAARYCSLVDHVGGIIAPLLETQDLPPKLRKLLENKP